MYINLHFPFEIILQELALMDWRFYDLKEDGL